MTRDRSQYAVTYFQRKKESKSLDNAFLLGIMILHSIFDLEHSRNQRQRSEFSPPIGFNMGICTRKVEL